MIPADLVSVIHGIHAAPQRLVLACAGGGLDALAWLHEAAGSSRTVLEAIDCYSARSLETWIGVRPDSFASVEAARALASRAWTRARSLGDGPALGVGVAAALVTDRPRKGDHRAAIVVRDAEGRRITTITLAKNRRDRADEEALVGRAIVIAVARACGIDAPSIEPAFEGDVYDARSEPAADPVARVLTGASRAAVVWPDGRREADPTIRGGILSGAFNPLHAGHEALAQAARAVLGAPVVFDLSIANADKGLLSAATVESRLAQFAWKAPVVVSTDALFVAKAQLFSESVFIVGADTVERLVAPRYYGGVEARDRAFALIREMHCSFLAAGRSRGDRFLTLHDIDIPAHVRDLFQELPADRFRMDISSTEVRARGAAGQS